MQTSPQPNYACSFAISPSFEELNNQPIICIIGTELKTDVLISESIVLPPSSAQPIATRVTMNLKAVIKDVDTIASFPNEVKRMANIACADTRKFLKDVAPNALQKIKERKMDELSNLDGSELDYYLLAERKSYAFSWVLENTELDCIRSFLGKGLSLPQVRRKVTSF